LRFAAGQSRVIFAWAHSTGIVKVTFIPPSFRMVQTHSITQDPVKAMKTRWETQRLVNAGTDEWATDSQIEMFMELVDDAQSGSGDGGF
jgi:hypothetical protein